jgi:hypothetical protein
LNGNVQARLRAGSRIVDTFIRIVIILFSFSLIVVFFKSVITVTLLTKHRRDPVSRFMTMLLWRIFRRFLPKGQLAIDRRMIWFWPITPFVGMATWFVLVTIAYTGFYHTTQAEPTWTDSFIASGSALSTLGFRSPSSLRGELVTITEGAFGLFIVVYMLTFIPGWLSVQQFRERKVDWIYARTGNPATGVGLVEWYCRNKQASDLSAVWSDCESWFRDLGEMHAQSPALVWARSSPPGVYWVTAIGALLDASALSTTCLTTAHTAESRICLRTGVESIEAIVVSLGITGTNSLRHLPDPELTRADFDSAIALLRAANAPINENLDESWKAFSELRNTYRPHVVLLEQTTVSPSSVFLPSAAAAAE